MNSSTRTTHHRPTARAPRLVAAAFLCVGATIGVVAGPASATSTDQVCGPLTSGKIDTSGDPSTVTVTLSDADIAAGKVITGYCVKAGSVQQADGGPVYVTLDTPVTTITFGHPSGKDVSHYSYSVGVTTPPTTPPTPETPVITPTPETPTTTPTPETPTTTPTPETPTTTPTPEVSPETETPEVLGEQASNNNNNNDTNQHPQAQQQSQPQVQPQAQLQVQPQQALPTSVNAGASPVGAPVSGTDSLLAMLLVLLGAVSARLGWTRARG